MTLLPIGVATADPPPIAPNAPLRMPKAPGPKLELPQVDPLAPPLMLEHSRPLQMPRSTPHRTLNRFPGAEAAEPEEDEATGDEATPRQFLHP
jgi:hypothetical protein